MNIYVSNLGYTLSDDGLKKIFAAFGEVTSARVMTDKFTHRSRGFGFVEMPDEKAGEKAISELNGSVVEGRTMAVNQAKLKREF